MSWLNGLSTEDKEEMYEDSCAAFHSGIISEREFTASLAKLGYNATDIEDAVKFYRPSPLENDGD